MNIAIITHVTPAINNGLSQYIRFLIRGLQEVDSSHHFYIFVNKSFDSFLNVEHPRFTKVRLDIPHYPRSLMRPAYFLWQNLAAFRLYKKYDIDLVHLPNPVPLFNTFDIPHIVTIHDTAELRSARHRKLHRSFRIFVNDLSAKKAQKIITVSEFSKNEIINLMVVDEYKINVTHPAITLRPQKDKAGNSKIEMPYFLAFAGNQENKNLPRLIEAFRALNIEKKVKLVLVGHHTKLLESFDLHFFTKSGIELKGYVSEDELIGYYQNAIALIYPSIYEGFGLPILEAMSLGVPVITANTASMPEVAGKAALLVNPESVPEITDAMAQLANNPLLRNYLIFEGYKQAEKFNWQETAQKTTEVYEEVYCNRI